MCYFLVHMQIHKDTQYVPEILTILVFSDTQRALHLLEEYRSKLSQTEDRQLRSSIERVINIFQSNLFQALIGGS